MRILITGSRDWDITKSVYYRIIEAIEEWIDTHPGLNKNEPLSWVTIVHGGNPRGADKIADMFSRKILGKDSEVFEADWRSFGRSAGYKRNKRMVNSEPDICLAFMRNNSRGTTDCRNQAKGAGIPTETFHYENELEKFPLPEKKD